MPGADGDGHEPSLTAASGPAADAASAGVRPDAPSTDPGPPVDADSSNDPGALLIERMIALQRQIAAAGIHPAVLHPVRFDPAASGYNVSMAASSSPENLDQMRRAELYELAKERELPGRSDMSVDELRAALAEHSSQQSEDSGARATTQTGRRATVSRFEVFQELARARAEGEMVLLPRMLHGNDRRRHVRQTIREDHEQRIAGRNEEAEEKFDKLAGSLFSFFRGTSLLFYRDLAGEDASMPTVLTLGDVHPENFGVMPSADNVPIFSVNDFDEAYYAPFTWDLKRGAVGFMIAAQEEGGYGRKKQRKFAKRFVRGYIEGVGSYASEGTESHEQMRLDNSPSLIADLIESAEQDRSDWLRKKYLDEYGRGFRADDEHVPVSGRTEEFQEAIDRFVQTNDIDVPERASGMRVKDVCERKGQGTASLGLARFYLLIEGLAGDGTDDLILEMKQARRSSLAGLVPPSKYALDAQADRIAHAQRVQLVRGDRFYGSVDFDDLSFMVRERAPYRDSIDLDELSTKEWKQYADICGRTLAQAHALSDDTGRLDHDVEPAIVDAIGVQDLFVDDMLRFAEEAADRVRADHEHFRADHELGAFRSLDLVYR